MSNKPKMTRKEAVEKSIRKWEEIVKTGVSWEMCGFCKYYQPLKHSLKNRCKGCPLYPDICNFGEEDKQALFWRWVNSFREEKGGLAIEMLAAIRERGQKWLDAENQK